MRPKQQCVASFIRNCCTSKHVVERQYLRVQNTSEQQQQQKTAAFEWWIRMLDLSCSQHDLFRLEIHKSFDCFSLPDMSFQSDPLRAIPRPGFVIYISTIVWSLIFWSTQRPIGFTSPPPPSPEIKRYPVVVKHRMHIQLSISLLVL